MNIKTESIKYAGSKLNLLPYIERCIQGYGFTRVLDGFAGSTRVGQYLAQKGMSITSNDISVWSQVLGNCYLKSWVKPDKYYGQMIEMLNGLPGIDGYFTQYYGGNIGQHKKPFQIHNTRKIDAIRQKIDDLRCDTIDKSVLLTSLMLAMEKVDSTIGHYVSYLSEWSARSYKTLKLELPKRFDTDTNRHQVIRGDIFDTIQKNGSYDLAYFDPPYGSNNLKMPSSRIRYAAYYHIWTTLILNDKPQVFGKVNRRIDTRDKVSVSVFEQYRGDTALYAINRLLQQTQADYVLMSYSSGGKITIQDIMDMIATNGKLQDMYVIDYKKNVMASMKWTNEWARTDKNREYLLLIKK